MLGIVMANACGPMQSPFLGMVFRFECQCVSFCCTCYVEAIVVSPLVLQMYTASMQDRECNNFETSSMSFVQLTWVELFLSMHVANKIFVLFPLVLLFIPKMAFSCLLKILKWAIAH